MSAPDADALYGLPLGEFTAARDDLARRLRDAGERERADAVHRLPKPTLAAWTVNRLAREEPEAMDRLMASGEALRAAQAEVIGGGDPTALQEAGRAERQAVGDLVERARALLAGAGRGDAALVRVRETLHAVAGDDEAREQVRAGRLARERRPGGLGGFALGDLPPGAPPSSPPGRAPPPRRDLEAERRRREARAALARAEADVARLEAEAAGAFERAEAAARAREAARAEAERAAATLEEARRVRRELAEGL